MKYFIKYLPVKGEIKQGDKVQYKIGEIISYDVQLNTDNLNKGKLFLCSKDIQVGDEVWNTAYNEGPVGIATELHDNPEDDCVIAEGIHWIVKSDGSVGDLSVNQLFKVIGEISPDALGYAKEGQEFDEDQIQKFIYDDSGDYDDPWLWYNPNLYDEGTWETTENKFKKVKMKGPCGHFH